MSGISRKQMIWLCHSMHTMLDAGLPMSRVLAVVSGQAPPGSLRRALLGAQAAVCGMEEFEKTGFGVRSIQEYGEETRGAGKQSNAAALKAKRALWG